MSVDSLARRFADFERRLKGLERGTRLDRAAVVVDDTGRSVAVTPAVVTGSRDNALQAARALAGLFPAGDGIARSVYFTAEEPTAPAVLDLWLRVDNTLTQYDGAAWVELADQSAVGPVAGLRSALATDDGRIVLWSTPTTPATGPDPAFGDLWLQAETVAYRWEGATGWQPLVTTEGQSLNYVPGEDGWGITPDGDSQFKDITSLGQIAAPSLSADAIILDGVDLSAVLGASSIGKIKSGRLAQQGSNPAVTTTFTKVLELNCGTVSAGRTYRVSTSIVVLASGTLALSDRFRVICRYTLDGSAPTTSSPSMLGASNEYNGPCFNSLTHKFDAEVDIASDANLKVGVFIQLLSGAGSYSIYAGASPEVRPVMTLYDDGLSGTRDDAAITLTGGGTSRFVKVFNPIWANGVQGSSWSEFANSAYCDVGDSSTWGNGMLGAFGFDSAAMVAALAGSSTPISCVLRWRPRYRLAAGGLDVRFLSHNFASLSAFTNSVFPQQWEDYTSYFTSIGTAANAVPGTPYDQSLGLTVFGQLKAGTRRGFAITNSGSPSYNSHPDGTGSFYSFGTYQPQVICTYDGTS